MSIDWLGAGTPWETSHTQTAIRYDLFPAQVATADGLTVIRGRLRVIIGGADTYVFIETQEGGNMTLLAKIPMLAISGTPQDPLGILITPSGDADPFRVQKDPGCGCGSRLRGMKPFMNVYVIPT